jgi:hypothetical protein
MKATIDIPDGRVKDLLTCALEGGSNHWYMILEFHYPEGQSKESLGLEYPHIDLPFIAGGSLLIGDKEAPDPKKDAVQLDRATMERGLAAMPVLHPKAWADFMAENEDANTGDVFLQCAVFGDVVFG